jgi:hypothetical protein
VIEIAARGRSALALAGGFTDDAKTSDILITRRTDQGVMRFRFNFPE